MKRIVCNQEKRKYKQVQFEKTIVIKADVNSMIKVIPQRAASKASCRQKKKGKQMKIRGKNEKNTLKLINRMKIISSKNKLEKNLKMKNNKLRQQMLKKLKKK